MSDHKDGKNTRELVVKSNRIVTAFQSLSLTEMCLIQLAIVDARETEQGLEINKPLSISAKRYAEAFDVQIDTAYKILAQAGKGLRARYFTFLDDTGSKIETNWVQQVRYVKSEGRIEVIFTIAVVNEITRLSSHFTQYDLEFIATLNSIYSVRLYELVVKWLSAKQTDVFDYEILRGQLGIGVDEYQRMTDFKKRVLDLAVNEINEKTNIKVKYENVKQGRKIIGFTFTVHEKPKPKADKQNKSVRDMNTADMFTVDGLSDKQLWRISRHKEFISTYSGLAKGDAGKNWTAYSDFIVGEIKKDVSKFSNKRPIREYLDGNEADYDFSR
ncbi:MAG: replication initiation protein RepM [Psychrobacter glacincola]|jgi:plasmid replication initiation protein|uniref:replication initiation protein RepM n=1 Tax=unclassified Psychrobacter TaxID=196806 RepID=UPI00159899B8|nr:MULTISPECIES: replication initiation protein RepM [unclassified Psychrobacter]QJS05140.1 plasmid replication protein B [Psychrobacter sp.]|tara:strand:+ start:3122 stop:4108 length:987 start_codon:yes stop_codon:yes gene_type:complete